RAPWPCTSSDAAGGIPLWCPRVWLRWSPSAPGLRVGRDGAGDVDDLRRCQAEMAEVLVVVAVELREVRALGTLFADSLHLFEDLRDQLRLGRDAGAAQCVLDDHRARVLAVDVFDLSAHVGGRDELVDRRMNEHARCVDARLM